MLSFMNVAGNPNMDTLAGPWLEPAAWRGRFTQVACSLLAQSEARFALSLLTMALNDIE